MGMMKDKILLAHGSGGKLSHELLMNLFLKELTNPVLRELMDSAKFHLEGEKFAFTTDSYTVKPIFFPGGDIGKLSVYGTVNDLAVVGARPLFISLAMIMEEGLEIETLRKITESIKKASETCGVKVVTGDTKVVEKGGCDGVFVNTSGLGVVEKDILTDDITPGDKIIVSGTMGDHGACVLSAREGHSEIKSDCAPIWNLVERILGFPVKFMRDPTRGGLVTTLNEVVYKKNFGIKVYEELVPVREDVEAFCEILGIEPYYLANEGRVVVIVGNECAEDVLKEMKTSPEGKDSAIVGEIVETPQRRVTMRTRMGGTRVLDMLVGEQLPRIC
jgi:hydrogenase expression/formation protein HypE